MVYIPMLHHTGTVHLLWARVALCFEHDLTMDATGEWS